uniref:hypothetical protein n=1 Tax=Cupriavidus taiwanensis TaxID=164546 RepID=UPI0011C06177|nr:hypothetical protein [Cupriavidus taiwanensis]
MFSDYTSPPHAMATYWPTPPANRNAIIALTGLPCMARSLAGRHCARLDIDRLLAVENAFKSHAARAALVAREYGNRLSAFHRPSWRHCGPTLRVLCGKR